MFIHAVGVQKIQNPKSYHKGFFYSMKNCSFLKKKNFSLYRFEFPTFSQKPLVKWFWFWLFWRVSFRCCWSLLGPGVAWAQYCGISIKPLEFTTLGSTSKQLSLEFQTWVIPSLIHTYLLTYGRFKVYSRSIFGSSSSLDECVMMMKSTASIRGRSSLVFIYVYFHEQS